MFSKKNCGNNPWGVGTLEWELTSPPPVHNFDPMPVVLRGPHEFANPEVRRILGRDWISQTAELPTRPDDTSSGGLGGGGSQHEAAAGASEPEAPAAGEPAAEAAEG